MKKKVLAVLLSMFLLAGCGSSSKLMKIETEYSKTNGENVGYKIEDENVLYVLNEQTKEKDDDTSIKVYEFSGKNEGETTVTIVKDNKGVESNKTYEVKVDKELNITYKEK